MSKGPSLQLAHAVPTYLSLVPHRVQEVSHAEKSYLGTLGCCTDL